MSVAKRLWIVAPVWRGALLVAICASAFAVLFPPEYNKRVPAPVPSALPPSSYTSPVTTPPTPSTTSPSPAVTVPRSPGVKFGDVMQHDLPFAGRRVPLPSGTWRVVASLPSATPTGLAIDMKALANESGGKLFGLVLLIGNDKATPSPTGFRADGNCERSDMIFTNILRNEDFGDQDCQYIDFLVPEESAQPGADRLVRAAVGDLKQRGVVLPNTLVGANFRFGSRRDLLIAKFYFNPEVYGISAPAKSAWLENDWNKYNLPKYPDKQKYVDRVRIWLNRWEKDMQGAWREAPSAIDDRDRTLPN